MNCQYCESESIEEILNLGSVPPVNAMQSIGENRTGTEFYDLTLYMCEKCSLVQIGERLNREIVFPKTYPYLSGMTSSLVNNFTNQATQAKSRLQLKTDDLVIDIGSNDGSLLQQYLPHSRILGVEPTQAAEVAIKNGIPTLNTYFDASAVSEIMKVAGKAKLITASNVFAHIDNMQNLIENIKKVLLPGGVFISESHYLLSLISTNQFDTIYHEHLRYYSFEFLQNYLTSSGFNVFHVEEIDSHGGSIRVWAEYGNSLQVDPSVLHQQEIEKDAAVNEISTLHNFAKRIVLWRNEFRREIANLVIAGHSIAGIGAPSRASTLITYAGLNLNDLIGIAELKGSSKVGKYMPGTLIPVHEESEILNRNPDYLLLLSWHLKDTLIQAIRNKGYKGKFIIPLPSLTII